ncbi:MAG: hypothetical protein JRN20_20560 [Nitrososphaerota archaeon]|nr:hypothetical protein [Nitrososphaerota archaeon]
MEAQKLAILKQCESQAQNANALIGKVSVKFVIALFDICLKYTVGF